MKKIVWISPYAPYDTVMHAGGKNHNFFVKYMNRKREFDIKLLTICDEDEKIKMDLDLYGIKNSVVVRKKNVITLFNIESELNPFHKFGGLVSNQREYLLKKLAVSNKPNIEQADAIIMQWTESLILLPFIEKHRKRDCKVVVIEEDVTFLRYFRKAQTKRGIQRFIMKIKYQKEKRDELTYLQQCNVICCLNDKDKDLLVKNGIENKKVITTPPYFDNYKNVVSCNDGYDILFYGFMQRKENETAAIWFIENVLPLLDKNYRFIILGGKPSEQIRNKAGDQIIVTGYVQDISPYLESSLCMVVPLLLGAGIKIKVLEALSAGKIILTNDIGVEGIPLTDRVNYFHCNTAAEYVEVIKEIHENKGFASQISINARTFIRDRVSTERGLDRLSRYLLNDKIWDSEENSEIAKE